MHQSFNSLASKLPLEFDYDAFTPNVTMKYWQDSTSTQVILAVAGLWPNVSFAKILVSVNDVLICFYLVHSALRVVASCCQY